jgi:hypothetical protein
MDMRAITTQGFKPAAVIKGDEGAAPLLQWVAVERLVVDPAYQREIGNTGRRNVAKIAAEFRWSRFSPVIVSPVAGGKLAIVDGQHRVTAAALRGFDQVPCQIIIADVAEQADAFRAINGAVTKMSAMQIHAAAVVAGEPAAVELDRACAVAQVTILRYPKGLETIRPGETMAVGALRRALADHGRGVLIAALQCITQTPNNVPGAVNQLTVAALGEVIAADEVLRADRDAMLQVFRQIEIEQEAEPFRGRDHRKGARTAFAAHLGARVAEVRASLLGRAA